MRWPRRKKKASRAKRARRPLPKAFSKAFRPVSKGLGLVRGVLSYAGPVAVLLGVLSGVLVLGVSSTIFSLSEIEVRGLESLETEVLLERARLHKGRNLLALDLSEAAARILGHPMVASVRLERRLPGKLIIRVREREPQAVVRVREPQAAVYVVVDGQGVVLREATEKDRQSYPLVVGVKKGLPPAGSRLEDPALEAALAVIRATEGLPLLGRKSLAQVDCSYPGRIVLKGRSSEAVVVVGGGDLERKFARLKTLAAELRRNHRRIRYIDLTFDRQVIVKDADLGESAPGRGRPRRKGVRQWHEEAT